MGTLTFAGLGRFLRFLLHAFRGAIFFPGRYDPGFPCLFFSDRAKPISELVSKSIFRTIRRVNGRRVTTKHQNAD